MKFNDLRPHVFSLAVAGAFACSHAQPAPDASAKAAEQPKAEVTPISAEKKLTPAEQFHAQGQADLDRALEQLKNVTLFFEFDSATLTKEASEKLAAIAGILGQRRADSAKKYLDKLGVKEEQITAISFGAEKPKAAGHDEEAWKQNRRDDVNAQK